MFSVYQYNVLMKGNFISEFLANIGLGDVLTIFFSTITTGLGYVDKLGTKSFYHCDRKVASTKNVSLMALGSGVMVCEHAGFVFHTMNIYNFFKAGHYS